MSVRALVSRPGHWLAALVFMCSVLMGAAFVTGASRVPSDLAASAVRVELPEGHGSGVHLGNGFFLTAGHVTETASLVTVVSRDGEEFPADVLWANHAFDVSLVYVPQLAGLPSAKLSCAANYVGQPIAIVGNPLSTEFAQSWGYVSATGRTGLEHLDARGLWRRLVTLDATAAPGVSGGPVYDAATGDVTGILVAGAVSSRGAFGYSYMVPAETICHVMGRVV